MAPDDEFTDFNTLNENDIERLAGVIEKEYKQFQEQEKQILMENAAPAFISGDLKAQKALDIALSFNLVNKEAIKYLKQYKADLERGGGTIQGKFIPWLEEKSKEDRQKIAEIIEKGYREGKATGVKQYQKPGKYGLYPKNTIANDLQEFFNERKSHASMVARTEIARIQFHGSFNRYKKQGVKKGLWLVFHPCPICEPFSRQVYDIDNLPYEIPVHPHCRCALAPVADDLPTGPAPKAKVPAVFEREKKALPYKENWNVKKYEKELTTLHNRRRPEDVIHNWKSYYEAYRAGKMSEKEWNTVKYYIGSGYQDFNTWLRNPSKYIENSLKYYSKERIEDTIETVFKPYKLLLDGPVNRETLPGDSILFRCCGKTFAEGLIERGEATDAGYFSTSTNFGSADIFGNSLSEGGYKNVIVMRGKKGDTGLYINDGENEFIKPRDTKIKLLGILKTDKLEDTEGVQVGSRSRKYRFLFVTEV